MADCAASGESVHVDADRLRVSAPAAGSPARAPRASAGALQPSLSRFSALHTPLSCPTSKAKVIFEGHKATSCFRHFNSSHHAQSHPASPYLSLQGPRTLATHFPSTSCHTSLFLVPWAPARDPSLFPGHATASLLRAWALVVPSAWTSSTHVTTVAIRQVSAGVARPLPGQPVRASNPAPIPLCPLGKSYPYLVFRPYCSSFPDGV